jgi:hypothetical protein
METKRIVRAALVAAIAVGVVVAYGSSTSVLPTEDLQAVSGQGNCLCNAYVSCLQCEHYGSSWVECSNGSNRYLECKTGGPNDFCGDCLEYGSDCGTYRDCAGPYGCVNCTEDSSCEGCTSGEGNGC